MNTLHKHKTITVTIDSHDGTPLMAIFHDKSG